MTIKTWGPQSGTFYQRKGKRRTSMVTRLRIFLPVLLNVQLCPAFVLSQSGGVRQEIMKNQMRATSSEQFSSGIPKVETGVLSLFEKYPHADGRGVKVAVLDTGCDLAAAGLQKTSDGKPKYLDFIDCTGDGDVDMNNTIALNKDKKDPVVGLSGRTLTLGDWANGVTEIRTGAVRLHHLLPGSVKSRLQGERKETFMSKHNDLISKTQRSLDDLQSQKDKNEDIKKERKDQELLLKELQGMIESYSDAGPLLDVVMFRDDEIWKVVIDLEANGDLSASVPMAPFGYAGQTGELGFGSAVTFCVQVYEYGQILSIVTDAGSHGTHVAGIIAANFVENAGTEESDGDSKAHLNGVAPGAQILACKIGDGRLDSAETGTGLIRALIAAKKYDIDLINLSYGEPSWQADSGRVAQTFSDAVYKWGMTVFTSAGNDGPALSSLGSPGVLSAPITVGAFVSSDMMVDQYSTLPPTNEEAPLEGASYYFSSRGPTPDGAFPDLCAPGGAIAPIPRHSLQGKAQYHGTSMSSPNACGVAACILSALKSEGIHKCGPNELRRGLVNSATNVEIADPFAQGAGLISAVDAVDYILSHHEKQGQALAYAVSIPSRNNARGLYIRDLLELEGPMTFGVHVKPQFDHAIQRTPKEMDELLSLEMDLQLKPSHPWVTCPERMTLLSATERNGQTFSIRVKRQDLSPGVHYATVDAIDATDPKRGPIFQVPVTVIVPHTRPLTGASSKYEINDEEVVSMKDNGIDLSMTCKLTPGAPNRRFITVPQSAEWATIKVRSASTDPSETSPKIMLVHAVPFVRGDLPNTYIQRKKMFKISEGVEEEFDIRVKGGATLEICLQLLWLANPSPTSVIADVEFHSLNTQSPTLVSSQPVIIKPASEFARLGASATIRPEKINPEATLKSVERTIRPKSYTIVSGSFERDILPPSDAEIVASKEDESRSSATGTQIYDMNFSYNFKVEADKPISVTPSIPSLFHQLYDSPLDSQLWVIEDNNSQILGYGSSMHHAAPVSLAKGDYTIKLHLRHPDRNVLEQVKDIPCQISFDLAEPLKCEVYSELDKASTPSVTGDGRTPVSSKLLAHGSHQDLYVSRPTSDLPSWVIPGDILSGSLVLDKDKKMATSMRLVYAVPPKPIKKEEEKKSTDDDEEDEKALEDAVFQSKIDFLAKLRSKKSETYSDLASKLQEERPLSIPLLIELLTFAKSAPKSESETNESKWRSDEVGKVKDAMLKVNGGPIDEVALAQYFGVNPPSEDELEDDKEAKELKKDMDEQKKALKAGLFASTCALGKLADEDKSKVNDFDASVKGMKQWVGKPADVADDDEKVQLAIVLSRHARLCQNKKALAMSILLKARKDHTNVSYKDITNELISICKKIEGMDHLIDNSENDIFNRFPVAKQKNLNL